MVNSSSMAKTCCATERELYSGTLQTGILRARAAAISVQSKPVAVTAIRPSSLTAAMVSARTWALLVTRMVAPADRSGTSSGGVKG